MFPKRSNKKLSTGEDEEWEKEIAHAERKFTSIGILLIPYIVILTPVKINTTESQIKLYDKMEEFQASGCFKCQF